MKKTEPINLMVSKETKKRLKEKAKELELSLTGFLEKIASEDIVFIDKNVKSIFSLIIPKENM